MVLGNSNNLIICFGMFLHCWLTKFMIYVSYCYDINIMTTAAIGLQQMVQFDLVRLCYVICLGIHNGFSPKMVTGSGI